MQKSFVVVRFSLHDECVETINPFATEEEARDFMQEDAHKIYSSELKDDSNAQICFYPRGARVSSCDDCFVYTWDICECVDGVFDYIVGAPFD